MRDPEWFRASAQGDGDPGDWGDAGDGAFEANREADAEYLEHELRDFAGKYGRGAMVRCLARVIEE